MRYAAGLCGACMQDAWLQNTRSVLSPCFRRAFAVLSPCFHRAFAASTVPTHQRQGCCRMLGRPEGVPPAAPFLPLHALPCSIVPGPVVLVREQRRGGGTSAAAERFARSMHGHAKCPVPAQHPGMGPLDTTCLNGPECLPRGLIALSDLTRAVQSFFGCSTTFKRTRTRWCPQQPQLIAPQPNSLWQTRARRCMDASQRGPCLQCKFAAEPAHVMTAAP